MEPLIQYRHTLLIPPLKGIQNRPSLHLSTILAHTSTVSEPASAFLLFLQRHQRHLPRAPSHTTALLRNLQQECPTTQHGSGFSVQSFMVWPHPTLQIICSPLRCSNSPPPHTLPNSLFWNCALPWCIWSLLPRTLLFPPLLLSLCNTRADAY